MPPWRRGGPPCGPVRRARRGLPMGTDYDRIAEEYREAKRQPWRLHVECFTLCELVGTLRGESVLDLACGEGFYSRVLRRRGAGRVVGVDQSARMIELA